MQNKPEIEDLWCRVPKTAVMGQENDEPNESNLRWNGSGAFSLAPSGDPGDKLRGRQ